MKSPQYIGSHVNAGIVTVQVSDTRNVFRTSVTSFVIDAVP